jgi:uncharacterized protein YoxC
MKYIQALAILILLITSKRYREKWQRTLDAISESNDFVEASLRRMDARRNGGKPDLRLL